MLVCAPAGYGKTTAVIDFVKGLNQKVIWFSVGTEDNHAKQLWKNLLFAFVELLPEIFDLAEDIFLLPDEEMVRELIFILVNKVRDLKREILLVFDDFHLIQNQAVSHGVELLIKNLPDNIKAIFISREILPFPVEKYRVNRKFAEVSFENLKFTKKELADLVSFSHAGIHTAELEEILLQNEGWITGIHIMLMEDQQGKKEYPAFYVRRNLDGYVRRIERFFLRNCYF